MTPTARSLAVASTIGTVLAFSGLLLVQVQAQEPGKALEQRYQAAEQALRSGPQSPQAWIDLLDALYALDQPGKALAAAEVALEKHPGAPGVVARAGRAYFRAGRLNDASRLLSAAPDPSKIAVGAVVLSKLLHAEGQPDRALVAVNLGLMVHANDAELHYQAALLNGRLRHHDLAAQHYARAAELAASGEAYPLGLIRRRCAGRPALHRAATRSGMNRIEAHGEAPFALPAALPLPTLDVHINGVAARMLLDLSGGAALSVDDDIAGRAGLHTVAAASVADLTGTVTPTSWAFAERVEFGGCRLAQVATQIYDFAPDNLPGIDGIVGAALFADRRLLLDLAASKLSLQPSRAEPLQAPDVAYAVLEVRLLSGDQAIVPTTIGQLDANAIIDIGSPWTCMSSALMARLKKPQDIRRTPEGTEVSSGIPFRIGRRTIWPPASLALPFIGREASSTLGTQVDMLLGWDVFTQMRTFAIDYPANQIIIEWLPPKKTRGADPK